MLVRADGVAPEAVVLGDVERQLVVVAQQHRLAVAVDRELGRDRAVEGPDRVLILRRKARMELEVELRARGNAGVELWGHARVVGRVSPRAFLGYLECDLWGELGEALVRPDRARRTPFDR